MIRRAHRHGINRWLYLLNNSFEVWLAVAAVVSCVAFFFVPSSLQESPVGHALDSPIDEIWSAMYGIGGVLMLFGLACPRIKVELIGLCLFVPAAGANSAAVIEVRGHSGIASVITLTAIAFASAARAWSLARSHTGAHDD